MANPFKTQFDSTCQSCGEIIYEGDDCFAVEGQFVCENCADANDNVCECGNYKKEEFDVCFECFEKMKLDNDENYDNINN